MKSLRLLSVALLLCLLVLPCFAADRPAGPPETKRGDVSETLHGVTITDPYRWLEDQNAPETRAWIDSQNAYTQSIIGDLPSRAALQKRLGELMKVDTMSAPTERNGRYFFTARKADQDLSIIYMRQGLAGQNQVLIDPHPLSADHSTSVGINGVSQDGSLLAYNERLGGADEVEVRFFDVNKRTDIPDKLERARYSGLSLTPDKSTLYYGIQTPDGPRVRVHKMGTSQKDDKQIFGDGYGRQNGISPRVSEDGRWLLISVSFGSAGDRSELYYQDLKNNGELKPLVNDIKARFSPSFAGDTIFVETNWNAPNARIMAIDLNHPAREQWKEIIPESDAAIQSFSAVGGKLFVEYLHNATSEVKIFNPDGKAAGTLRLPSLGSVGGMGGRWVSKQGFYRFTSFVEPGVIYRYDMATGKQTEWSRVRVPLVPAKFEVKQVWYESKDKTRVPMFLVYAKGLKLDGSHPTLLTGYGGFNLSRTPGFSAEAVIFAEHGGVYALPNLRGGGEFGEKWHKAGMLANKQNVFDDFIGAGEWLVANKYTAPAKLAISGGSNGGLLVGAALTQRPDLFRAVVCSYPLLDMVRYHQFLVAPFWVPEYGSSDDPTQFQFIYKYSPYHNVKQGTQYPAVLLISGDSDTRVAPLHARKMTALLQAANGGDRPIMLHYDTKAGHSGGKPISKQIDDLAEEYGFLMWQLGVGEAKSAAAGK